MIEKTRAKDQPVYEKGWGKEIWIENCAEYCGKILVIKKRKRGSLHFHKDKKETMLCVKGKIRVELVDMKTGVRYSIELTPGDSVLIPPGQIHRLSGLAGENRLIEFSTYHRDSDSYRVEKGD